MKAHQYIPLFQRKIFTKSFFNFIRKLSLDLTIKLDPDFAFKNFGLINNSNSDDFFRKRKSFSN